MPYYINLKTKHKFFNHKSIPLISQKILGIMSGYKHAQKKKKNEYEKFQEWLNSCPVKIIDYEDLTDQFQITFYVPLENENS